MRGLFLPHTNFSFNFIYVFPTPVGMNRDYQVQALMFRRVPHARGDEPDLSRVNYHG